MKRVNGKVKKTSRRAFLKTAGIAAVGTNICFRTGFGQIKPGIFWISPAGDDNNNGTENLPFRTIQKGVDSASPGDTIYIHAGRYIEQVNVPAEKGGKEGQWLTISSAPGEELKAVIGPDRPHIDSDDSPLSTPGGTQYIRLRGLSFQGCYRSAGGAINISRSKHVEIINCRAYNSGAGGIDANNCDYISIDRVEVFFNGGGSGWSSGISLLEPGSANNSISNCQCYGNYDWSSYRTDGNGIIIDWTHKAGAGCLVINNLCYMNGGLGMASTGSDNILFLNNTCVANSWGDTWRNNPGEIAVRGNNNLLRNNIGIQILDGGTGLLVLSSKPGGQIAIDFKSINMDHNIWWNPTCDLVTLLAGEEMQKLTMKQFMEKFPHWSQGTLNIDPGFVDIKNLDFRLRPGSAALKAGSADERIKVDITGRPRPSDGSVSAGCYEGAYEGKNVIIPKPEVIILKGEDTRTIKALLSNEYSLEWHGMLWGWGQQLYEEMPLIIDVEGPRKADFLDISGSFILKELLEKIAQEHNVRLLLRQPANCKGIGAGREVISERLAIRKNSDDKELAHIRSILRYAIWTNDTKNNSNLADLWRALQLALGMKIDTDRPIPPEAFFNMTTQNLKLDAFLYDVAERLDLKFTLSVFDPITEGKAIPVESNVQFGDKDGLVEIKTGKSKQSDNRSALNIIGRFGEKEAICARVSSQESSLTIVDRNKPDDRGRSLNRGAARLEMDKPVRFAIAGKGCALSISNGWILLSPVPEGLETGSFMVSTKDPAIISSLRYTPDIILK